MKIRLIIISTILAYSSLFTLLQAQDSKNLNSATVAILPIQLFDESFTGSTWGIDSTKNNIIKVDHQSFNVGDLAIHWKWSYNLSPELVKWGFALNRTGKLNIASIENKAALEFFIKTKEIENPEKPEITITLEDNNAQASSVNLDIRYISESSFGATWQKVIIPLADFYLAAKGVDVKNMKQIIISANWYDKSSHEVFIDDIALRNYSGKPGNPFNKERYNLFVSDDKILTENDFSSKGCFLGGFVSNSPAGTGKEFSFLTGRKPACVMWYSDWGHEIDIKTIEKIMNDGYTPQMVWEAMLSMVTRDGVTLNDILDGKFDTYIHRSAKAIATLPSKMQIRIFHEFNGGSWYPWCPKLNGGKEGAEKLKTAWKRIHNIFNEEGANKNVEWVFCMYKMNRVDGDVQKFDWNQPLASYPGDEFVDWIGVDFYNYYPFYDETWKSYKEQFASEYLYMATNFPNKPIQISEFASNQAGGDKGQWFKDMNADNKTLFPRLKQFNYFEINKEADWRIASSPESQRGFQEIMHDNYNRSSAYGLNRVTTNYKDEVKLLNNKDLILIKKYLSNNDSLYKSKFQHYIDKRKTCLFSKLTNPIIDGIINANEWSAPSGQTSDGSSFYIAYDDSNLYLAGKISDTDPMLNARNNAEIINGDCIEIALCLNRYADSYRTKKGNYDTHLCIKASDKPIVWCSEQNKRLPNTHIAFKKSSLGYDFEAKIPLADISKQHFEKDQSYDFDIAIDNGDLRGLKFQSFWNASEQDAFDFPYKWGTIKN